MPSITGPAVRQKRREEARARQLRRDERTPEEQLALLDQRLGVGQGAKRERARLLKQLGAREEEMQQ